MLSKASSIVNHIIDICAIVAMVIIAFVMALICVEVITRNVFHWTIPGSVEISSYSLVYITFLGTAWLLRRDGHVRMDFLFVRFKPPIQALLNIITSTISVIVWLSITWFGTVTILDSFQIDYRASSELRTPMFLILLVIPLGSSLLSIQLLRKIYLHLKEFKDIKMHAKITNYNGNRKQL